MNKELKDLVFKLIKEDKFTTCGSYMMEADVDGLLVTVEKDMGYYDDYIIGYMVITFKAVVNNKDEYMRYTTGFFSHPIIFTKLNNHIELLDKIKEENKMSRILSKVKTMSEGMDINE